jgi:hypothetical protein
MSEVNQVEVEDEVRDVDNLDVATEEEAQIS